MLPACPIVRPVGPKQIGWPRVFDDSLGFPGEGPLDVHRSSWSLSTVNVGSLKSSTFWKSNSDVITCVQETRVGRNNFRTASRDVAATGRTLFCGALLPGIIRADGHHTTMHGGTAVIAPDSITTPFSVDHDVSGLYALSFDSKRANAIWVQISHPSKSWCFRFTSSRALPTAPTPCGPITLCSIRFLRWLPNLVMFLLSSQGISRLTP